jgi:hypothetical protein
VLVLVALLPKRVVLVGVPLTVNVKDVLIDAVRTTLGNIATRVSPASVMVPPIVIRYELVIDGFAQRFVEAAPTVRITILDVAIAGAPPQTVRVRFSSVPLL